jgi:hypothetical protein
MHRTIHRLSHRMLALVLMIIMTLSAVLAGPAPLALADEREETLFRATFSSEDPGALSGPLDVAIGTVVPDGGTVAITDVNGANMLTVGGAAQSTALLQWSNYPDALPGAPPPAVQVRIKAKLFAESTTGGGTFGILAGSTFFELVSFGPGGELRRAGSSLGVTYAAEEQVELEVFIRLPGGSSDGKAQIKVASGGSQQTIDVDLPGSISATNLNQLRMRVPAGGALLSLKEAEVQFKQSDKQEDDDPPAVIIIRDDDIEREIEMINGVAFINIRITFLNTGGKARGSFLVIDLDDLDDLDLAEVSCLEGAGFVRAIID